MFSFVNNLYTEFHKNPTNIIRSLYVVKSAYKSSEIWGLMLYSWWILLLCCWQTLFFCKMVLRTACKSSLFRLAESSPFCNSYYLFTLSFLSKQTRHGRNIVSYFFLFICGRAKCSSCEQCVGSSATVDAMCSSCSLPKYLELWPAALYEDGRSALRNVNEAIQDPENWTP
jgi:hypothetical protein